MKKLHLFLLILFAGEIFISCKKNDQVPHVVDIPITVLEAKPVTKTNNQKVYVHYMPWYEDPSTTRSGNWGQSWTMANKNPNIILANGRRQIASWFYPMIGPYASSDKDVIDYHTLLMKYAGIDGVIVDWSGIHDVYDELLNKRNTDAIFNRMPQVGLQFAICYEDGTLKVIKAITGIDTIQAAREDFAYLESQYFGSNSYIKINNQPLLLCFGPQVMKSYDTWQRAFAMLNKTPRLLSLLYQGDVTGSMGSGEFLWIEPGNLASQQYFYQNRAPFLPTAFAGAYPGFKDFYEEGGWSDTSRFIEYNGVGTLKSSLNLAKNSNLSYVQLITWNDFGEGTMLEPTLEYNYSFLEAIQQFTGVTYTKNELELIYKWYTLRRKYRGDYATEQKLSQAYYYLVALDVANAANIISGIS